MYGSNLPSLLLELAQDTLQFSSLLVSPSCLRTYVSMEEIIGVPPLQDFFVKQFYVPGSNLLLKLIL